MKTVSIQLRRTETVGGPTFGVPTNLVPQVGDWVNYQAKDATGEFRGKVTGRRHVYDEFGLRYIVVWVD